MRRPALICACAALLVPVLVLGYGSESEARATATGRVVNRDGVAQPRCHVEFRKQAVRYSVYTDSRGYFDLNNPQPGRYDVTVAQGSSTSNFTVTVTDKGELNPSVLRVPW